MQHRAQVFQIEQQEAVVVGDLEHQIQHAGLGLVEFQHARQQQRAHVGNGRAHRVPHLTEGVPESHREGLIRVVAQVKFLHPLGNLGIAAAGLRNAGQITFHIGHETGHADG